MDVSPFFSLSCLILISFLTETLLLSPNSPFYLLFWCVWSPEFEWGSVHEHVWGNTWGSQGTWVPRPLRRVTSFLQAVITCPESLRESCGLTSHFFQDETLNGPILCRSCAGNTVAVNSQPYQPRVSAHHVHQVCFQIVLFNVWCLQSFLSLFCDVLWA